MKWVEANPDESGYGGGGGPEWVEVSKHVSLRRTLDADSGLGAC